MDRAERQIRHMQAFQAFLMEERDESLAEAQRSLDEAVARGDELGIEEYQRWVDRLATRFPWEEAEPAA